MSVSNDFNVTQFCCLLIFSEKLISFPRNIVLLFLNNCEMFNPTSFYSILQPMFFITQFVGLVPFSCSKNQCKRSNLKLILSLILLIVLTVCLLTLKQEEEISTGFIANVTKFFSSIFSKSGVFCEILFGIIYVNNVIELLQSIQAFDKGIRDVLNINLEVEYRRSKIYSTICVLSVVVLIIGVLTAILLNTIFSSMERYGELIILGIPPLLNSLVILQFCTLVICIKQRFGWLNKKIEVLTSELETNLPEYESTLLFSKQISKVGPSTLLGVTEVFQHRVINYIEDIRVKHYELCERSYLLNRVYYMQIFFVVLQDFMTIITSLYYSSKTAIVTKIMAVEFIIYSVITFILALLRTMVLVSSCSNTASEAQSTGPLIHKLLSANVAIKNKNKESLQLEVSFFSLQLLHQKVKFTVCRIFPIDETLIFSMVGVITTYLVIVIQFELS